MCRTSLAIDNFPPNYEFKQNCGFPPVTKSVQNLTFDALFPDNKDILRYLFIGWTTKLINSGAESPHLSDVTVQMPTARKTDIEYGDECFSMVGPQLFSEVSVKMTCRYRGDGKPACFVFSGVRVIAEPSNLLETNERGLTTIGTDAVQIRQIEHILSALFGMDCIDTDITLEYLTPSKDTAIAPPISHLDAKDFTLAIRRSFLNRKTRKPIEVDKLHFVTETSSERDKSFAVIAPHGNLHITAHVNFPHFWGKQIIGLDIDPITFEQEVCWARSFFGTPYPHLKEWEQLREKYPGLIRERENHYRSVMIDYDNQKWLTPLFSHDEPARHKLLDFIGDLALIGAPLNASVYVYKPHHKFNREVVKYLKQHLFSPSQA